MKFLQAIMLTIVFSWGSCQLTYGYVAQIYTLTIENKLPSDVTVNATYDYDNGVTSLSTETLVPAGTPITIVRKAKNPYPVELQKISFITTGADGSIIGQEIQKFDLTRQRVHLAPQRIVSSGFKISLY